MSVKGGETLLSPGRYLSGIALPSTKGCCFILFRHLPGGELKKRRNGKGNTPFHEIREG